MLELSDLFLHTYVTMNNHGDLQQHMNTLAEIIFRYRQKDKDEVDEDEEYRFVCFYNDLLKKLYSDLEDFFDGMILKTKWYHLFIHLIINARDTIFFNKDFSDESLIQLFAKTKEQIFDLFLNDSYFTQKTLSTLSFLPPELSTSQALKCWVNLICKKILNNALKAQEGTSKAELAYIGKCFSEKFNYKDKQGRIPWSELYEKLWGSHLAQELNRISYPDTSNLPRIKTINWCFDTV